MTRHKDSGSVRSCPRHPCGWRAAPAGRYNPAMRLLRLALCLALPAGLCLSAGCVRRTMRITSDPSGALVWVNDREVGRTPVNVEFVHYGTYDVRLVKEGWEPLLTFGRASPPLWDVIPLDLLAELAPVELKNTVHWHYTLEPSDDDRAALVDRARDIRAEWVAEEEAGGQ
jgi:hypothetical protein